MQTNGYEIEFLVVPFEEGHFRLFERDEDSISVILFRLKGLYDGEGSDDPVETVSAKVSD